MLPVGNLCSVTATATGTSDAPAVKKERRHRRVKVYKPFSIMGYKGKNYERMVPLYRFRNDVVGNFFKQFCDTFAVLTDYPVIEILRPVAFACPGYDGNPADYTAIRSNLTDRKYVQRALGAILLENGQIAVIYPNYDTQDGWFDNIHLDETSDSITLKYGNYKGLPMEACDERDYSAVLRVLDDKKVDLVSMRQITTNICDKDRKRYLDWIEDYYREHGLAPGCSYYTQFDFDRYIDANREKIMPWYHRQVHRTDTIW